eukprot:1143037-Pelagomonas_calceolata.AAC.6
MSQTHPALGLLWYARAHGCATLAPGLSGMPLGSSTKGGVLASGPFSAPTPPTSAAPASSCPTPVAPAEGCAQEGKLGGCAADGETCSAAEARVSGGTCEEAAAVAGLPQGPWAGELMCGRGIGSECWRGEVWRLAAREWWWWWWWCKQPQPAHIEVKV